MVADDADGRSWSRIGAKVVSSWPVRSHFNWPRLQIPRSLVRQKILMPALMSLRFEDPLRRRPEGTRRQGDCDTRGVSGWQVEFDQMAFITSLADYQNHVIGLAAMGTEFPWRWGRGYDFREFGCHPGECRLRAASAIVGRGVYGIRCRWSRRQRATGTCGPASVSTARGRPCLRIWTVRVPRRRRSMAAARAADGAPHRSVGDFGTVIPLELGLELHSVAKTRWRIEALSRIPPLRFAFRGPKPTESCHRRAGK